jgi:chorismate-pyruvate lyase
MSRARGRAAATRGLRSQRVTAACHQRRGIALLGLLLGSCAALADSPTPHERYVLRLEAALLLQTLNAELLSHSSATETLQRWCAAHALASPARIIAERVAGVDKPPSQDQRLELKVSATDEVRYRRVQLRCGTLVLSEADNWYVPARLTAEMNRALERTDSPFGLVVRPLHFERHTLSAETLWQVMPRGWEEHPGPALEEAALCRPKEVLRHRALLTLPDGTPFSEVVETYTGAVLAGAHFSSLSPC